MVLVLVMHGHTHTHTHSHTHSHTHTRTHTHTHPLSPFLQLLLSSSPPLLLSSSPPLLLSSTERQPWPAHSAHETLVTPMLHAQQYLHTKSAQRGSKQTRKQDVSEHTRMHSLSHSLTNTHTHSLTHTHTRTHTHTLTHSPVPLRNDADSIADLVHAQVAPVTEHHLVALLRLRQLAHIAHRVLVIFQGVAANLPASLGHPTERCPLKLVDCALNVAVCNLAGALQRGQGEGDKEWARVFWGKRKTTHTHTHTQTHLRHVRALASLIAYRLTR